VYVAAGSFLYGSRDGEGVRSFFGTVPMHEVHTDAFLIGTTEVTYASWLEFVDALPAGERGARLPHVETSPTVGSSGVVELREVAGTWTLRLSPASVSYEAAAGSPIVYRERISRSRQDWREMPVTGISPDDAQAYADWLDRSGRIRHARLCTEREWEHAMRGVDGRSYPHGDRLASDEANFDKTYGQREGGFGPDVVGSHPASTSPYGLLDGSGNAAEIVRSASGTGFVSRGGCFYTDASSAHLANRQEITPTYRHVQIGVRICADP
jgi:formylglycine-generating enzyme required for sulfatase activity